jgi:hypothetical protein
MAATENNITNNVGITLTQLPYMEREEQQTDMRRNSASLSSLKMKTLEFHVNLIKPWAEQTVGLAILIRPINAGGTEQIQGIPRRTLPPFPSVMVPQASLNTI